MTPIDRNGQPTYKRIQNVIRRRIETGKLMPGDVVDSERELAKLHKVSLMTARHALADLAREGIVERRRGAGTYVAPPKIHFNKLMSYTEQMASRGLVPQSNIVSSGVLDDEPDIAARLSLSAASHLTMIERVRKAGDEPFALESCYLSAQEFPGLIAASLERGSLFSTLENRYGVELAYADEEIDVTAADLKTAELLAVPRGSPLLRIVSSFIQTRVKPSSTSWAYTDRVVTLC